ncbi:MAG: CDP-alcohol phosphatidyltransferase family protein [Marmoricola sp.]|nr:CDP-alcohol phosphatidyltransferase family protein [Marmoricola sp.]
MPGPGRVYADPVRERVVTDATVITAVRTVASVSISAVAAWQHSLTLLVVALVVHWVGDSLDGWVARVRDCETRTGALLDILSDRLCAAAFYIGLVWLEPHLGPAVFVYLLEFMVIDGFLSMGFLAWPLTSPNHFHVVDRRLWLLNWSHPGKAVNSGLFAILLVVTGSLWAGLVVAVALLGFKCWSLARLVRLGMPVPERPVDDPADEGADDLDDDLDPVDSVL